MTGERVSLRDIGTAKFGIGDAKGLCSLEWRSEERIGLLTFLRNQDRDQAFLIGGFPEGSRRIRETIGPMIIIDRATNESQFIKQQYGG